jgi:hypothetical protein
MTKPFNPVRIKFIIAVLIIALILLVPAAASAESEAGPDTGSADTSEAPESESSSAVQESSGSDSSDDTTSSSNLEIPLSDPVDQSSPEEPSSDSNENPASETPPDGTAPESSTEEENTADLVSELPSTADSETPEIEDEESADQPPAEGDCYVATVTPDAVVSASASFTDGAGNPVPNAGSTGTFTVTFTELGEDTIGSARVDIPSQFTSINYATDWTTAGISTSGGQIWEGMSDDHSIYLRAADGTHLLGKDESVSVTFEAVTPGSTGAYEFATRAWTGITGDFTAAGTNDMAAGYIDPVVIVGMPVNTASSLNSVRCGLTGHYVQVASIDLSGYSSCGGWEQIGTESNPFTGSYNGNGYTITALTIEKDSEDYLGLFGYTGSDSLILNVNLSGVDITGNDYIGGIVGYNNGGTIINSSVSGEVNGGKCVGGLVGNNDYGNIIGSSAAVAVEGSGTDVGGLVGYNNESSITNSYATGCVTGTGTETQLIGGLVGNNENGVINNSHASGDVSGYAFIGGLVGYNRDGTITGSHATGAIVGNYEVGGLVGRHISKTSQATIDTCYTTGAVTGRNRVGGLVGYSQEGSITRSYAAGSVEGEESIGGLVGSQWSSGEAGHYIAIINECYASGTVEGVEGVGGLVANNSTYSLIIYSYATGSVTGSGTQAAAGGLVGENMGSIARCYAAGAVAGDNRVGGLVGYNSGGTVTGSYYDRETTGQSDVDGRGEPRTTAEMKDIATFMDWDIVTLDDFNPDALPGDPDFHVWYIDQGEDYPRLWWQYEEGDDFPWSGGFGMGQIWDSFNLPALTLLADLANLPVLGPTPKALVFPSPEGDRPLVTADFVKSGTTQDLACAITLYIKLLQTLEENRAGMSPGEYARAMVELAVAWAAIQALDARLLTEAGLHFISGPQVDAYLAAVEQLTVSGGYLSSAEMESARAVLKAVAEAIEALGLTV